MASGANDRSVKIWAAHSGECLQTLDGHEAPVYALAALSDGLLASGCLDGTIRVWDWQTGECKQTLSARRSLHQSECVLCLAVVPPDAASREEHGEQAPDTLVSGSSNGKVTLWHKAGPNSEYTIQRVLRGHAGAVQAVVHIPCVAGGAGMLATSSHDDTIRLWCLDSGKCVRILQDGHHGVVYTLALLDGMLVSGSLDRVILLWDCGTGEILGELAGHENAVCGLAVLPDGALVSGGQDRAIRVWQRVKESGKSASCCKQEERENCKKWESKLVVAGHHRGGVFGLAVLSDGSLASASRDKTVRLWQ